VTRSVEIAVVALVSVACLGMAVLLVPCAALGWAIERALIGGRP
jgi:hypothetical protein